jgi:hypothetical protein
MAEKVIKIQSSNGGKLENFYIKFYVDMIYPCFNKFKSKLVERCPELEGSKEFSLFWIGTYQLEFFSIFFLMRNRIQEEKDTDRKRQK